MMTQSSPNTSPSPRASTEFLDEMMSIVGQEHVHGEGDLSAFEIDWRRKMRGRALAVVRPASTAQVAEVVRACARYRVPIVAQGGNTGLVGGGIPDHSGTAIVLQLGRMHAVRQLDKENLTVSVEAGCILQTLQEHARDANLLFPLSLGAEGSCMIGGNLATNAGGTQVLRYGNSRDLCLGLEVVMSNGEIWSDLSGLRKNNTGYDLRQLFIGSEGTLGIITAATMKLYPQPKSVFTAWVAVRSVSDANTLLSLSQRVLGAALTGFELMSLDALRLVARHMHQFRIPFLPSGAGAYHVLIEVSDHESEAHARYILEGLFEQALENGSVLDAAIAENTMQAEHFWSIREHIPLAQAEEGPHVKHDVSIPISRIPDFVDMTERDLQKAVPGVRVINFGHLGDGNLHFNVHPPADVEADRFVLEFESLINDVVYGAVDHFSGSFSAEHGIGLLKMRQLEKYKPAPALEMMFAIKRALDPDNIMNPGRILSMR